MRVLFANDGIDDAGGVHTYLESVMSGLRARGHEVGLLHCNPKNGSHISPALSSIPYFGVTDYGLDQVIEMAKAWGPQVCFSHNMSRLDVESRLLQSWPVVKLMHGYFGTCAGGQKTHSFPERRPCDRRFGQSCAAFYFPLRCGQMSFNKLIDQYKWARWQNDLFKDYTAVLVASEHMKREYVRNGMSEDKVHVNALFASPARAHSQPRQLDNARLRLLFLGRMTSLKGGDILIRAARAASERIGKKIHLIMAGDGPRRADWEKLAARLNVSASFTGWVTGEQRSRLLEEATLLAVPSIWPEPFGLVGLEAASAGLPAIAFDVGGIRQWLTDGVNGYLIAADPPSHKAMAEGLAKAFMQPEELIRMGCAARKQALDMSLEKHLDNLEGFLSDACAERVKGS